MNAQQSKLRLARLRLMENSEIDYLKAGLGWANDIASDYDLSKLTVADRCIISLAEELEHTREILRQYVSGESDY